EQVFPADLSTFQRFLDRHADAVFVAITLGTIEVAKPGVQGFLDRLSGDAEIAEQCAKSNRRHFHSAVIQRKSCIAKVIVKSFVRHIFTPMFSGRSLY